MKLKKIAITMGEPGGIGPEIIARALHGREIRKHCAPIVIGNVEVMRQALQLTGLPLRIRPIAAVADSKPDAGRIEVMEVKSRISRKKGAPSRSAGISIVKYIQKAAELAMQNEVSAIVTAPISKESLKLAGYGWPGHTELLADLANTKKYAMMFVSDKLKVILCTIHTALKNVPGKINKGLILKTINLAALGSEMLGIKNAKIAVAGLNPHAGESGIMGKEELSSIAPAVEKARASGIDASGPYPPDVVFYRAYKGDFEIVVCMYHDQGLIPFKMLAFDTGVNLTVGLPFIRTSPDHGTGFDIAWKGLANPSSLINAVKLAAKLEL